ncbi:MAG TPA: thioredoxin [Acetobacterium sp.]|nr:thioredoxin [Acetobacterium sp.]
MSSEKVITINMENFETEILSYDGAVMVDFWAEWCGPCKALSPTIDEISQELEAGMKVCKINVDDNQALAQQFRVMSIPTVVFFKNGEAVNRFVGVRENDEYIEMIKSL